jgi:hypothetical protein
MIIVFWEMIIIIVTTVETSNLTENYQFRAHTAGVCRAKVPLRTLIEVSGLFHAAAALSR